MTINKVISSTAILAITPFVFSSALAQSSYYQSSSYNAHEACKAGESKRKLVGGGLGAVVGGVAGSKIAGKKSRTKGAVIGGVVGGAAGYGIADKTIDCDPVYQNGTTYQSTPQYPQTTTYQHQRHTPTRTYHSGTTTYAQPVHTTTGYTTRASSYPVRTIVSDHPVYNKPAYGATTHTYAPVSQPAPQPRYIKTSTSRRHVPPGRRTAPISYRNVSSTPVHYHGKHQCYAAH